MLQKLQHTLAAHLAARDMKQEEEIYQHLISFVATAFCLLTHLYLLVVFLLYSVPVFVLLNTASTLLYALMFQLHRRGKYMQIVTVLSVDVTVYTTVFLVLAGLSTHVIGYYLLVCVLQVILPYGTEKNRIRMLYAVGLVGLCTLFYSIGHAPRVVFPPGLNNLLTVSNVLILFLGTMVQIYMGNLIKRIIERLNEIKLSELSVLANTDPLTGLYNRRFADVYLEQLSTQQERTHCVAMLDIDDFKLVNDTWGHACGDEVLVAMAQIIRQSLRKTDVVFRWGGEEILVILDNVRLQDAHVILEKLRQKIGETIFCTDAGPVQVTVTIGVAPLDSSNPQESIAVSDRHLYWGKQHNKNVVVAQ